MYPPVPPYTHSGDMAAEAALQRFGGGQIPPWGTKMEKIKIIDTDLLDLLEDSSESRTGYLDLKTGDILTLFDSFLYGEDEEQQEILDQIEENPDRYLEIDPIGSREGYRIMEKFVATLPEGEDRNLLNKVLSWKKPFSNFRNAIAGMGDIREKWFHFHDKQLRIHALEWLALNDAVAELVSYGEK